MVQNLKNHFGRRSIVRLNWGTTLGSLESYYSELSIEPLSNCKDEDVLERDQDEISGQQICNC
eukprot:5498773-Pleurochrysis_carterae.AAC.2